MRCSRDKGNSGNLLCALSQALRSRRVYQLQKKKGIFSPVLPKELDSSKTVTFPLRKAKTLWE